MVWARAALAGGLLVLLAAFATGTEHRLSTSVAGQAYDCGPSISASWLVPGTPDHARPGPAAGRDERRAAAVCGPVVAGSRALVLTAVGLGSLLALVGWSAIRAQGKAVPPTVAPAHS